MIRNLTKYEKKVLSFVPESPSWATVKILTRLVYPEIALGTYSSKFHAVRLACIRLYKLFLIVPVDGPRFVRWHKEPQ